MATNIGGSILEQQRHPPNARRLVLLVDAVIASSNRQWRRRRLCSHARHPAVHRNNKKWKPTATTTTTTATTRQTITQLDHRHRRRIKNNNSSSKRQRRYQPLPQRRHVLDIEQEILFRDNNNKHNHHNNHHQQQYYDYVVGSDESGVGAIAGPVVAVSCSVVESIDSYVPLACVRDGKRVSIADCQAIYEHVVQHTPDVYRWTCSILSPQEIDDAYYSKNKTSVQQLTLSRAFGDSIPRLAQNIVDDDETKTTPPRFYSIVDGPKSPPNLSFVVQKDGSSNNSTTTIHSIHSRPWQQADAAVYTVALASCLARALHHQHMRKLAVTEQYERYDLARRLPDAPSPRIAAPARTRPRPASALVSTRRAAVAAL